MISKDKIKFECVHFLGDIPCKPNKLRGKICDSCDEYEQNAEGKSQKAEFKTKVPENISSDKILIIKLGAAGDVIRSTPLLARFKREFPSYKTEWMTENPEVLPQNTIDKIYIDTEENIDAIKNSSYKIAVNLDKDKEACELLNEVIAEQKFGFTWENGHISATNDAAWEKLITGIFDQYSKENTQSYQQEIFSICGFEFNGELPFLSVNNSLVEKWKSILEKKSSGKKIIGLNTGCGSRWKARLWQEEKWIELIKKLQQKNYFPMLLGGPDEDEMNRRYEKTTNACYPGTFTLEEFIAISSNCDVIVTAVSMMMHIATALQKPIVLFNNIFNKHEFELYGKGKIIEPATGCDDYYGQTCSRKNHCMNDINPSAVFEAIEELSK